MKQYDKNSLIGFVLMAVILIVFNTFFFPEVPQEQAPNTTPTEAVISETQIAETVIDAPIIPTLNDSIVSEELKATYGIFAAAAIGEDEFQIIENDKLKITVAELSKANIHDKLQSLDVSQQHIDRFIKIIKTCEMALFAGLDNSSAMQETYNSAKGVIVKIEEELN